jgi:hypothetical protein
MVRESAEARRCTYLPNVELERFKIGQGRDLVVELCGTSAAVDRPEARWIRLAVWDWDGRRKRRTGATLTIRPGELPRTIAALTCAEKLLELGAEDGAHQGDGPELGAGGVDHA